MYGHYDDKTVEIMTIISKQYVIGHHHKLVPDAHTENMIENNAMATGTDWTEAEYYERNTLKTHSRRRAAEPAKNTARFDSSLINGR